MKLDPGVLAAVAMVAAAIAVTGCKSSVDQGSQPGNTADPQPGVQAPSDSAAPSNSEDPNARRARRHRGRGRAEHRMRRAQGPDSGTPSESPEQAPQ